MHVVVPKPLHISGGCTRGERSEVAEQEQEHANKSAQRNSEQDADELHLPACFFDMTRWELLYASRIR